MCLDGPAVLKTFRRDHPETEVIVRSTHRSCDTALVAMRDGAFDAMSKPNR
jgi:DNA-binding NtrC family response regulator